MDKRLISALILMISTFGFFAFVLPSYGKIKVLRQAIEEREKVLADKKSTIEKISSLAQELDSGKANVDRLALLMPQAKSLPEIISSIESAASQSGLAIAELKFSEDSFSSLTSYQKVGAEVRMTGSYLSSVQFLKILETNIRLTDVNSISIAELPGGGLANLSITIKFDSYYLIKK